MNIFYIRKFTLYKPTPFILDSTHYTTEHILHTGSLDLFYAFLGLKLYIFIISGSWNKAEPFSLFQAPEIVEICEFQGPQWVKKALFYFRSLKASKRCNFRPRKSSISDSFWSLKLNFKDWCNSTHFTTTNVFQIIFMALS